VLDAALSSSSMRLTSKEELRDTERMWELYLNGSRAAAPAQASPASCADLERLPPAYIVAGELDTLRDEAIAYGQRLLAAGVTVELHVWPKVPHAVDLFVPDARISRETVKEQAGALARFLA